MQLAHPHGTAIPTELCERIIDALGAGADHWDDDPCRRALHACALVCRAWRPRVRLWLLRRVRLFDDASCRRLVRVLEGSVHGDGSTSACGATGAGVGCARFVREAWLYCGVAAGEHPPATAMSAYVSVLWNRLRALGTLHVWGVGLSRRSGEAERLLPHLPLHPRLYASLGASLSSVTVLDLHRLMFGNFADFARLVGCFSALEELVCDQVDWTVLGPFTGFMRSGSTACSGTRFLRNLRCLDVSRHETLLGNTGTDSPS